MGTKINTESMADVRDVSAKEMGAGVKFQRVRRITGYLSEVASFNNGKRAELSDRVKHGVCGCSCGC